MFRGFQDKAKVEQAEWEKEQIKLQKIESENRIRLQVREVYNNLEVSLKAIETATLRLRSARKSFEIIDKKYREGMSSLIEFIDARSTMTRSELNYILTKYDFQIKLAEFERVLAADKVD